MSVPDHIRRYPTANAICNLAKRFGLPNGPHMQDWEWEVSDASRLDEFLAAYSDGTLDDDERFTLMEIIIQSCDDLGRALHTDPRWLRTLQLLDLNIELHASSVWYWSSLDTDDLNDAWEVAAPMRQLLARHLGRLERH